MTYVTSTPHFSATRALLALLSLWLLAFSSTALSETTVRASVDRSQLSMEETFTLTLSADSIVFSDEPDVSALAKDFHVLRRQQSSRSNIINGKVTSSRQWDYTLAPKREGDLTIPSIPMGKYHTRPLTVSVRPELKSQQRSSDQVFLESDITPRTSYVQAQLDYTVKIFTSVNFLDASLDEPELDNAVIENLGENRYQTQVDGRYYQVIERHYAIFPQTSGDLEIPALTLQARVEGYRSSLLDPGRLMIKRSQSHRVRVLPPPKDYQGQVWLPAQSLAFSETWSRDLESIHVGDSITRSIDITAQGLLGSQLPALPALQLPGAKVYPDQAKIDKQLDSGRLTGTRKESLAIIPTQAGELVLPEQRIPWWNIAENRQEVAILPERRLNILPAAGSVTDVGPSPQAAQPNNATNQPAAQTSAVVGDHSHRYFWLAISLLGLLNLVLVGALWRARKHSAPTPVKRTAPPKNHEAECFKALQAAAKQNRSAPLRNALLAWARASFERPLSLTDLAREIPDIGSACQQLDNALYGNTAQVEGIDTNALITTLKRWRKTHAAPRAAASADLPPLYPSR
jgi:hypothetical protein